MSPEEATTPIELRVENVSQLFHTLDPFPFREKDLDREAEEYIVGWARELPLDQPIRIVVHAPEVETLATPRQEIEAALHRYFSYRADVLQRELNELFRVGRRSLAVGATILVICLFAAQFAAGYLARTPFAELTKESFLILGWVANWRPLEIFLYDWLPLARRRNLYRRLALARIDVIAYPSASETPRVALAS